MCKMKREMRDTSFSHKLNHKSHKNWRERIHTLIFVGLDFDYIPIHIPYPPLIKCIIMSS